MTISNKVLIPSIIFLLVVAAGGGWYFGQRTEADKAGKMEQGAQGKVLYTCPMHPFIIKDKPGACPICGMALVKKIEGGEAATQETAGANQVVLSPTQQVQANVATVEAKKMPFARSIDAVGIVQYDQARQAKVTAWVSGRLDKLYVDKVGDYVSAKRPVAEVYSPDLLATQQEYLLALKSRNRLKGSSVDSIAQGGEGLVASARQRLMLWGVKESQIAALEKEGKPNIRLSIYTPQSGIVIDKMVQEGQYVKEGDPLFSVADLSTVWVEAELYENEFPNVKLGQRVEIVSQSYPGTTFKGRVAFIYPFLDPKTRTVKVRIELPNPGLRLRPDMFVNASIKVPLGNVIAVPDTAVMDTGTRKVIWVEVNKGTYEPRDVETGPRVGDYVQVLSGLREGDTVVSSGGYLIDSEAQLKGGGGGSHAGHEGMKTEGRGAPVPAQPGHEGHRPGAPAQPKNKDDMKMDDMKM